MRRVLICSSTIRCLHFFVSFLLNFAENTLTFFSSEVHNKKKKSCQKCQLTSHVSFEECTADLSVYKQYTSLHIQPTISMLSCRPNRNSLYGKHIRSQNKWLLINLHLNSRGVSSLIRIFLVLKIQVW